MVWVMLLAMMLLLAAVMSFMTTPPTITSTVVITITSKLQTALFKRLPMPSLFDSGAKDPFCFLGK
eukprot:1768775-Rhodomonas_salina.1